MTQDKKQRRIEELVDMLETLGIKTVEQLKATVEIALDLNPDDLNNEESLALAREKFDAIAKMANA